MGTPDRTLVTIAIPTFNRARTFLPQALEGALAQSYAHIEVIVADNGSTDDTQELVASYSDPRIRYFRHERNLPPNDNFNFCIKQARGEYLLLLLDDDTVDRDFIETCLAAAGEARDVGMVRTGTRIIDEHGRILINYPNRAAGLALPDFFLSWFASRTTLYLCSTLFRTEALRGVGGLRSRHNLFQDVMAEVQIAANNRRVDVEAIKAGARKHAGEWTFSAKINSWCEDSIDLLELMCLLVGDKSETVRRAGMRFFADINYSRATPIRSPVERLKAHIKVFKTFRRMPSVRMIVSSFPIYRRVRQVQSKDVETSDMGGPGSSPKSNQDRLTGVVAPTVSVVIPTYNRAKMLPRAIHSAAAQTYRKLEIIIVDDCSDDATENVVNSISDPRIIYERHPRNRGGSAARNTGIRLAKGDYVAFLDDDDEWMPEKIMRQLQAIQGYDAVVCASLIDGTRATRYRGSEIDLRALRRGFIGGGTSVLMARAQVVKELEFDETLPAGQDWDLMIRIAGKYRVRYLSEPYVIFNNGAHARITTGMINMPITRIESRMQVLTKHRSYLGSFWFNFHLSGMLLYCIRRRSNRARHLMYTLRRCGPISVFAVYVNRLYDKFSPV